MYLKKSYIVIFYNIAVFTYYYLIKKNSAALVSIRDF